MEQQQPFKNVLIIGVGLIGGSLGSALKRKGFTGTLMGVDDEMVLEGARQRNIIDEAFSREQMPNAIKKAELIFLCTPIAEILRLIQSIGSHVRPNTLITDVGSTKRKIIETANLFLPSHCDFIGGHPMAGSEQKGVDAADPFLFENTTYVLTPSKPIDEMKRRSIGELIELTGAKVLLLSPALHDEIAAAVSHLPQMVAIALMSLAASRQAESPHFLKMAAGGFRDITRVASSPYGIWEDILSTNSDMIVGYIDAYINELHKIREAVESSKISKYFDQAARQRLSIPKDTRGFLKPHYDISISVEDRPGMIATIANALLEKNINIKDIEVLKIRENEGGTMRLAFSSEVDREIALALLKSRGLECRKRD
ncbi:prephenate dehydrogenase [candidate division KSB1 bacterium]|nr:prephenate dehydrogenase [candidate division KSB1 bacterium]